MAATSSASCLLTLRSTTPRRSISSSGDRFLLPTARRRSATKSGAMACSSDGVAKLLAAAKLTVDNYVKNGMIVGLGSGPASCMAIHYLGSLMKEGTLTDIVGIPMSISSASEAVKAGIPLDQYRDSLQIDFAFSDADVIEEGTLAAIIGRRKIEGEESIMDEKSIILSAGQLAFIIDESQCTSAPEGSVPVLVKTVNWIDTAEEIDDLFLGDAEVWRRATVGYAGPSGGDFPFVTKEGYNVLDVIFTSPISDLAQVAGELDQIEGVVYHGIVSGLPCTAVIASDNGPRVIVNLPVNASDTSCTP